MDHVFEILGTLDTFAAELLEFGKKQRLGIKRLKVGSGPDAVVGEGIFEKGFAHVESIRDGWQDYARNHSVHLRGGAGRTVKFLNGHFQESRFLPGGE